MYDHTLHRGRNHFCRYCLQTFSTEEILKRHIKDCFKMVNKCLRCLKIVNKFKNFERKIKSPFMFCADFDSILVPEDNAKQSPEERYMSKFQKHGAWSYGYKLERIDDKFS